MIDETAQSLLNELERALRLQAGASEWLVLEQEDKALRQEMSLLFGPNEKTAPVNPQKVDIPLAETRHHPGKISGTEPKKIVREAPPEIVQPDRGAKEPSADPILAESLDSLHFRLRDCDRCGLWETRKTIVFGQGNINADLVFIGEGPGGEEDKSGVAFVGRAGKLLTQIIQSIGISRESVFICNVVKCRPPGNRNPTPEEIETCSPFLFRQLEILKPKLIVTLGNVPTKTLLPSAAGIMKMRGNLIRFKEIPLIPTFHPSYLLRNPSALSLVWDDMRLIRQTLFAGRKDE